MGIADWIILVFLGISAVGAAVEGFFQVAFHLAGLIVGYLLAAWQYQRVAAWFAPYLKTPWVGEIAGFLIIFLAVLIVAGIAGRIAHWVMKKAGLSAMDRALGALLGLCRGALIVAVVLVGVASFAPAAKWLAGSQLAPYFLVGGRAVVWLAPSELRNRFYQGLDYLQHSASQATQSAPAGRSR